MKPYFSILDMVKLYNKLFHKHDNYLCLRDIIEKQAFNWESHKYGWWKNLEKKVADLAKCGFTSAWLPPATHSLSPEGQLNCSC